MRRSINQEAQVDGDTTANEVARIRFRERAVSDTWRAIAYHEGEAACTAARIAKDTSLPEAYVVEVCAVKGHTLRKKPDAPVLTQEFVVGQFYRNPVGDVYLACRDRHSRNSAPVVVLYCVTPGPRCGWAYNMDNTASAGFVPSDEPKR